jgi:peptidoglycan/LPS O-acetylase OafA/YrhL
MVGFIMIFIPCFLKTHSKFRVLITSHFWNVLEELSFSAYLFISLVIIWFFSSRQNSILMTMPLIIMVSISSCFVAYLIAVPFYLFVERPFKNLLNFIVFPNRNIFKKQKDVDDSDDEEEDEKKEKEGEDNDSTSPSPEK